MSHHAVMEAPKSVRFSDAEERVSLQGDERETIDVPEVVTPVVTKPRVFIELGLPMFIPLDGTTSPKFASNGRKMIRFRVHTLDHGTIIKMRSVIEQDKFRPQDVGLIENGGSYIVVDYNGKHEGRLRRAFEAAGYHVAGVKYASMGA